MRPKTFRKKNISNQKKTNARKLTSMLVLVRLKQWITYSYFSLTPLRAVAIVGRAITIWEAIQKRSHEPIYKTHTKIEAKRLRATTFAITKLEE